MAQIPPHILNPDTPLDQNLALINDNFDKAVQNLADLGANVTSTVKIVFSVNATSIAAQTVAIISPNTSTNAAYYVTTPVPVSTLNAVAPQVDIYIDNDLNAAYLWPFGGGFNLATTGNFFPSINVASTSFTNAVAAFTIGINNRDSSPHTYYVYAKAGYLPAGTTGVYR